MTTPAATLNRQRQIADIRRTVAGDAAPIPIAYGLCQIGGRVFALDYTDGVWTVGYALCLGEIQAIDEVYINGDLPTTGTTVVKYTGTTAQTADSLLSAKIASYADTLVHTTAAGSIGIAYVVIQFAATEYDAFPELVAQVRGRKVYNGTTTAYSVNPALHLADFLTSTWYGAGKTVDATSLASARDACDEVIYGEARRTAGIVIDAARTVDEWVAVLETYAGAWVTWRGSVAYLVPDRPASSVATFTAADVVQGSLYVTKQDSGAIPTIVRVYYTDTTDAEWVTRDAVAYASGVVAGTTPRRESQVRLPGVQRYSQARREAIERLNKLALADLTVTFDTFDEALKLELGDVITLTHPLGFTSKLLRLSSAPVQSTPGRWTITAQEYDAAAYSDEVQSSPSYPDTGIPDLGAPSAPTGLTATEVNYRHQDGTYLSRIAISWTAHSNPTVNGYAVEVLDGATLVWSATVRENAAATPPLQDARTYTVNVSALTPIYIGTAASTTRYLVGKTAIPTGPASLSGFEVGGEVRLSWPADTSDFDVTRYEVRYSTTAQAWADAIVLDQVDALRFQTRDVPPGTWRFHVKSIDSIRQYSSSAATRDITVTLDDDAILVGSKTFATGSTTFLYNTVEDRGGATVYYSDGNDTWSTLFGAAAMSTFTSPLASYQTAQGTSEWLSDEFDGGLDITGDWQGEIVYTDLSGTATAQLGVKPAAGSYTYGNLSQKTTARYGKVRLQSAGIFKLAVPGPSMRVDAIAREETGTVTTAATGATTISLANDYAAVKSIALVAKGTTARTVVYDNIQLSTVPNTFDIYAFNTTTGAQIAADVVWTFKGV